MRYGLAIIVIAFLAIVTAVVLIGSGNSGSGGSARNTKIAQYDSNDAASISWTQQGRLVGEDQRRAIRVTITRDKRMVEVLAGFPERVEKTAEYPNSFEGFEAFTRSLDTAKFGLERNVAQPDERGVCPTGNRFIYRVTEGGKEIMRTWSDTCSAADGPFGGGSKNAPLIAGLFKAQITDYSKFIQGVKL